MAKKCAICGVFLLLVIAYSLYLAACASDNSEDESTKKWTVTKILVQNDDIYDFRFKDQVGQVKFRKFKGPVGSRVNAICRIDELSRLNDRKANVRLFLINDDAIRATYEPIEWVQEGNERTFHFLIPLVETVPTLLNFRVQVYEGDPIVTDDDDDDTVDDDDDTTDDDTTDDDDDTVDDDDDDDDTVDDDDDDTVADDDSTDDDDAPNRSVSKVTYPFEAWGDFLFVVNDGTPGTGD